MSNHALLSPSSAHRWMHCAGSLALESTCNGTARSAYADEGTAAHHLAATALANGVDPNLMVGETITLWTHPESESSGACFLDEAPMLGDGAEIVAEIEVNQEMADAVKTYVAAVREQQAYGFVEVEKRVWFSRYIGVADQGGTADAIVVCADDVVCVDEIQVHDFKYGRGVKVDAECNEQLMLYALGACDEYELFGEFKRVRLFIHQPRINHVSEWSCDLQELRRFAARVKERAYNAIAAFSVTPDKLDDYFSPGEKQCKFCKAKAKCPAIADFVQGAIGAEFDVITADAPAPIPTPPPATLGLKLAAVSLIEDWCKAVYAAAEAELRAGRPVDGFKLVAGKRGARAWSDETEVEAVLRSMRLKQDEMYNFKLISPTQCEKVLADSPRKWTRVSQLITQSDGKPTVVPETDKRPAIGGIADDFEAVAA